MRLRPSPCVLTPLVVATLAAPADAMDEPLPLDPGWDRLAVDTNAESSVSVTFAADPTTCADELADAAIRGDHITEGFRFAGRGRDAATGYWRITVTREGGALYTLTVEPVDEGCRLIVPIDGHTVPATRWRLGPVRVYASGGVELVFDRLARPASPDRGQTAR